MIGFDIPASMVVATGAIMSVMIYKRREMSQGGGSLSRTGQYVAKGFHDAMLKVKSLFSRREREHVKTHDVRKPIVKQAVHESDLSVNNISMESDTIPVKEVIPFEKFSFHRNPAKHITMQVMEDKTLDLVQENSFVEGRKKDT